MMLVEFVEKSKLIKVNIICTIFLVFELWTLRTR